MDFIELSINCSEESREILIAEIAEIGFDSMIESEVGFQAYCTSDIFDKENIQEIQERYANLFPFTFTSAAVKKVNWNKEWEKNFQPVEIGNCRIRASFHNPDPNYEMEIIIDPKMSFGTGHHETTSLMVASLLEMDCSGKEVLDCGFGTGILSIISALRGASTVIGTDIDEWCVENAIENAQLNGIDSIEFGIGKVDTIDPSRTFDIIIANINKNILLDEISAYAKRLRESGELLLSGFYETDLDEIKAQSSKNGLIFLSSKTKNNWVAAYFQTKK